MTDQLLPVRLRDIWLNARSNGMSDEECAARQKQELDKAAATWTRSLLLPGEHDIVQSTLSEVGRLRGIDDLSLVRRRCEGATDSVKQRWRRTVQAIEALAVERFYDSADDYIEELMWWHTLVDDNSPLAYVAALEFAVSADCRTYLDFGSGVGALLFRSHNFDVTLTDISGTLLSFCRRRFEERRLKAKFIDLKQSKLPEAAFDFVTAMDVFEHLVDPLQALDALAQTLKPGGYIYGRFAGEEDKDRPQHIVLNFRPVFERFAQLGFREVFRDDWLWGHQVFQKPV